MEKQKIKKLLFFGFIILSVGFVILYNIYYSDKETLYVAEQTVQDESYYTNYSLLKSKEDKNFLGIGEYYPPNHLNNLITLEEHLDFFDTRKQKIYNDIYFSVENYQIHIQIVERRRIFVQKSYHANISVNCDGIYYQQTFYGDDKGEIDFTNEDEVISVTQDICKDIIKTYQLNKTQLQDIFDKYEQTQKVCFYHYI